MNRTHFGTENHNGIKFCNHCGRPPKSMVCCAKCGFDNAPSAKFFCGEGAGGLSADSPKATILDIGCWGATEHYAELGIMFQRPSCS
jgi:hypothetical protein